jgi:hypothetical protein
MGAEKKERMSIFGTLSLQTRIPAHRNIVARRDMPDTGKPRRANLTNI